MAAARDGQNQTILTDPTKPTATNWMRNNSSISISNTGTSPAVASSILPSLTDVTTSNGNNNSHDNSRNQTPKNINNNIRRRTMSTSVAWERGYFDSDSAQGNEFDDDYDDGPQELHDLPVAWERNISAASQISTTIKPRASSEKRYIPGYSPSSIPRTTTMTARPAQLPELKSKAPPKKQTFSKAPLASTPYYDLTTASSTKPSTTTTLSLPTKVDSAPLVVAAVSARKTTEASKAVPAAALSTDTVPATASVEPAMAAPPPNDAAPTASRAKTTAMANKKSTSKNEVDSIPSSSSVADSAQGPNGVAPTASRPKITSMANNAKTNEPKTEATANAMKAKDSNNNELLNPLSLLPVDEQSGLGKIPYPKALSPSSIKEFQACPQSFFFQYILGLKQPTTAVLAKGSMCHSALERLFDLDPGDRSLPVLQNLFRTVWSEHRLTDLYRPLFEEEPDGSGEGDSVVDSSTDTESSTVQEQQERVRDVQREVAWGRESLQLLDNYWRIENAAQVMRPNPVQREMWVRAPLSVQGPRLVADDTAALSDSTSSNDETFLVRGIIDRLDMVQDAANKTDVTLRLIDYKSGKAPDLKYSPSMNEKIQKEAFEQLLIYALLHRETGLNKKNSIPLRYLRLFYLTSVVPDEARFWDLDLGATSEERDALLNPVHTNIAAVWKAMCQMIDLQDPTVFTGCERSFCYCHKCRSRFIPGTVWEPQS